MATDQGSKELSAQGLAVYKLMLDDIAFIKKQQWVVTNYGAAIYGAIFVLARGLPIQSYDWLTYLTTVVPLIGFTIMVGYYGFSLLDKIQEDLKKARERVSASDGKIFGSKESDALGITPDPNPATRGIEFTDAMKLVLTSGAALLIIYLFTNS
jgi:hypothetical protein